MKTRKLKVMFSLQGLKKQEQTFHLGIKILPTLSVGYFKVDAGGFIDASEKRYTLIFGWLLWLFQIDYSIVDDHSETWTN